MYSILLGCLHSTFFFYWAGLFFCAHKYCESCPASNCGMKFIHETLGEKILRCILQVHRLWCTSWCIWFDISLSFLLFFIPRWRKIDVAAGHVVQRNNCATDRFFFYYYFILAAPTRWHSKCEPTLLVFHAVVVHIIINFWLIKRKYTNNKLTECFGWIVWLFEIRRTTNNIYSVCAMLQPRSFGIIWPSKYCIAYIAKCFTQFERREYIYLSTIERNGLRRASIEPQLYA